MAASTRFVASGLVPNLAYRDVEVSLDASYPTGGYVLSAASLGMKTLRAIVPSEPAGYSVGWDMANGKLVLYTAGGTQVANATNLSTVKIRLFVIGEPV